MSDDEDAKPSKVAAKPEKKINDDMGVIEKRAKDVEAFLARQQAKEALLCAINDPPLGSKNQEAKTLNYKTVIRAISAVKEADVPGLVDQIFKTQGDVGTDILMKYVFRGLAEADSCAVLLKWHGVLVEVAGLGCIVRAMTDRKTA